MLAAPQRLKRIRRGNDGTYTGCKVVVEADERDRGEVFLGFQMQRFGRLLIFAHSIASTTQFSRKATRVEGVRERV